MKCERKSNFELMRIISMLMIILWHIIIHGHILENCNNTNLQFIIDITKYLIIVHVNLYVLLTGYFQVSSKFNFTKIIKIINSIIFYNLVIYIVLSMLGFIDLTKVETLKYMFVLNNDKCQYWFVRTYILLYIISPFLNLFIEKISQDIHKKLLLVLFVIMSLIPFITGNRGFDNNGFTLYNFVFLYFIGAYFRYYPLEKSYSFKIFSKNLYRIILVLIYLFMSLFNYCLCKTSSILITYNSVFEEVFNNFLISAYHYSNPIIIIQSIAFFLFFSTLDIKNKFINKISTLVLGVYMIHENYYIQPLLYKWLRIDNGPIYSVKFILYIIVMNILIFIVCILIEYIRQLVFKFIYNRKISKKITKKINYFISSIKTTNIN